MKKKILLISRLLNVKVNPILKNYVRFASYKKYNKYL